MLCFLNEQAFRVNVFNNDEHHHYLSGRVSLPASTMMTDRGGTREDYHKVLERSTSRLPIDFEPEHAFRSNLIKLR